VSETPPPERTDRTDTELLRAHVDGDSEAFGELFGRHRDRLWAVAMRTMGNPEDAADGLQDGMIAAFRRAGSFRGEAAVTTWLHRVVVNACLDRLRAAKVRRAEPLPEDLEDIGDRGSLVTSTTTVAGARWSPRTVRSTRPTSAWPLTGAAGSWRRSTLCRPPSEPPWSSSTWRATPSTRWRRCSAAPRAR